MKKYLILLVFLANTALMAQLTVAPQETAKTSEEEIHNVAEVEKRPEFPGGIQSFYQFVAENYMMPDSPELKSGRLFTSFVIEKDGTVTDVKILRDLGFGTGEEAIRVLQNSPKWIPGQMDGTPVRVQYSLPITLTVKEWVREQAVEDNIAEHRVTIPGCRPYQAKDVDQKAEFPGGLEAFFTFIGRRFKIPEPLFIDGKIFVTFVIRDDGSLTDIKVIRDIGRGTDKEIIRVLKLSPNWKPARVNGENVCVLYSLPITIKGRS